MTYEPTDAQIAQFFQAVSGKYVIEVREMLKAGFPPNATDSTGTSALCRAAHDGDYGTVHALLEGGADPNFNGTSEDMLEISATPLHNACGKGNLSIAWLLMEYGADPTVEAQSKQTAFHGLFMHASKGSETERWLRSAVPLLHKMLDGGMSPNCINKFKLPLLGGLIISPFPVQTVEMLLERGADPKAKNREGMEMLHVAAAHNRPDVVRLLVGRGIEVDSVDEKGRTPLHQASTVWTASALMELGAWIDHADKDGNTPLHVLVEHSEMPRPTDKERIVQLLEAGARVDLKNHAGRTSLDVVREKNRDALIPLLAAAGARQIMARASTKAATARNEKGPS